MNVHTRRFWSAAGALAGASLGAAVLLLGGCAANAPKTATTATPPAAAATGTEAVTSASRSWHARQSVQVQRRWGIDIVGVRRIASGWMLEFRYRVLDPEKAKALAAKASKAYLVDEATGTRMAVPAMENVGELRQTSALQKGRDYFIVFGNPNRFVQPGSLVSIVVSGFTVEGIPVE